MAARGLRTALGITLLLPLLAVAQEGAEAKYDEVLQKLVGTLGEITKTLEGVKDEESAGAARPELRKQAEEFRAVRKKSEELAPPAPEVREPIAKKYRPELEKVHKQLRGQMLRVRDVPGGPAALQEIRGVFARDPQ